MSAVAKRNPRGSAGVVSNIESHTTGAASPIAPVYIPHDWRARATAKAADYYRERLRDIHDPEAEGWTWARCPMHDGAGLRVNFNTGRWRCDSCALGGDAIELQRLVTGQPFKRAVRTVLGLDE